MPKLRARAKGFIADFENRLQKHRLTKTLVIAMALIRPPPNTPVMHPQRSTELAIPENPFSVSPDLDCMTHIPMGRKYGVDFGTARRPHPFDFDLPAGCKPWPIPIYDVHSQHAHRAWPSLKLSSNKHRSRKRTITSSPPPKKAGRKPAKLKAKAKATSKSPAKTAHASDFGRPAARDQTLHLLSLPGEIRNQIYRSLVVSDEPVHAQFRRICTTKKYGKGKGKQIRRYPLEPKLALANHQLREEVLGIFYGENTFIFCRNKAEALAGLDMTTHDMLIRWQPRLLAAADALQHMELRFTISKWCTGHITHTLRKHANGRVTLSKKTQLNQFCTCLDDELSKAMQEAACSPDYTGQLVLLAASLVLKRREMFGCGASHLACATCRHPRALRARDED